MSLHNCPECLQLWQTYLRAATEHIALKLERQMAEERGEIATLEQLDREIERADAARRIAKQNAEEHDAARHPLLRAG